MKRKSHAILAHVEVLRRYCAKYNLAQYRRKIGALWVVGKESEQYVRSVLRMYDMYGESTDQITGLALNDLELFQEPSLTKCSRALRGGHSCHYWRHYSTDAPMPPSPTMAPQSRPTSKGLLERVTKQNLYIYISNSGEKK